MRAAVYHGKEDVRFTNISEPVILPGSVLIEVEWCGLCGSDLHLYQSGPDAFGDLTKHGEKPPFALGHEFCGRVRSPPGDSGFQDGDPVMIDPRIPCGECVACETDKDYGCPRQGGYGYNHGGGLQERVVVPVKHLRRLPDIVPLEYAALIEPFAVAIHAIRMTGITDWSNPRILVLGGGPVGMALIIALRAHQARTIIVSEPASVRREQVSAHVDVALDPSVADLQAKCLEMTDQQGIDVVFDCAGAPEGLLQGLDVLRCEGMYMNLAMYEQPMTLPVFQCLAKHITLKFALVYNAADLQEAIRLFAEGKFRGHERTVTKRIGLREIVEDGFHELINHKDDHVKILVSPKLFS